MQEEKKTKKKRKGKMHIPAWCFFLFCFIAIAALVIAIIALVQQCQNQNNEQKRRVQIGTVALVPENDDTRARLANQQQAVTKSHADFETFIFPVAPPELSIQPPPPIVDYEKFFDPVGGGRHSIILQCANIGAVPVLPLGPSSTIMTFGFYMPKSLVSDFTAIVGNTIGYYGQAIQSFTDPQAPALGLVGVLTKVRVTPSEFFTDLMKFELDYNFPSLLPVLGLFQCNFYIEFEWTP